MIPHFLRAAPFLNVFLSFFLSQTKNDSLSLSLSLSLNCSTKKSINTDFDHCIRSGIRLFLTGGPRRVSRNEWSVVRGLQQEGKDQEVMKVREKKAGRETGFLSLSLSLPLS